MSSRALIVKKWCLIDWFAKSSFTDDDVQVLRRIIMNPSKGGDLTAGQKGCWDKIMEYRYISSMPTYITRIFHYAVYDEQASKNLVYMQLIFFVMVAHEACIQRIIVEQLKRCGDTRRLDFFQNVFIQQARLYIKLLFEYPFTRENAKYVLVMVATELRIAWSLQLDVKYKLTRETEKLTIQRDIQTAKDNKLAQAKLKEKTGRRKRRRALPTTEVTHVEELNEKNDNDDDNDGEEDYEYGEGGEEEF